MNILLDPPGTGCSGTRGANDWLPVRHASTPAIAQRGMSRNLEATPSGLSHAQSESELVAALPSPRESPQSGEAGAEEEKGGGLWDNCPDLLGELNRTGSDR